MKILIKKKLKKLKLIYNKLCKTRKNQRYLYNNQNDMKSLEKRYNIKSVYKKKKTEKISKQNKSEVTYFIKN